jgi:hypothetical protein
LPQAKRPRANKTCLGKETVLHPLVQGGTNKTLCGFEIVNDPQKAIDAIEALRRKKGATASGMCRRADISLATWINIRKRRTRPQRFTLQCLWSALLGAPLPDRRSARRVISVENELPPIDPRAIRAMFKAALVLIAKARGMDPDTVLTTDFSKQRPDAPGWLEASRCRQMAIYFVRIEFEIESATMARAIGLTPPGVRQACNRVEKWRDDPAIDELLDRVRAIVAPELRG